MRLPFRAAFTCIAIVLLTLAAACQAQDVVPPPGAYPPRSVPESPVTGSNGQSIVIRTPNTPAPASGRPAMIALHGVSSGAVEMEALTGFTGIGEDEGFVVAYADAGDGLWLDLGLSLRDGLAASQSDIQFISDVIEYLVASHDVDPDAVFLSGFSAGALFAIQFACEHPDLVAGIGVVAGAGTTEVLDDCALDEPVRYIAFHGTEDPIVPYEGGSLIGGPVGLGEFSGAEETAALWAERSGCSPEPRQSRFLESAEYPVTKFSHAPCDADTAVVLYAIVGGAHGWPGGNNDADPTATTSSGIDASRLMWTFFRAH